MIKRNFHLARLRALLKNYPVVAILGARQVGKTTLARQLVGPPSSTTHWFDLEDPRARRVMDDPIQALEALRGLVVIDEIQQAPDLFKVLRVLADRPRHPARFVVLGSAHPALLRQSSESLAGRISYYEVDGFSTVELTGKRAAQWKTLWQRGGFPRSFLSANDTESFKWRSDFSRNFIERDLPGWGYVVAAETMRRFWQMLTHYHGQRVNFSELGRSFGISDNSVRKYLDELVATFMVRQLQPWFENIEKRQVKAPKIYFRDSGMFHALAGIRNAEELQGHPKSGASWEGFALEEVIAQLGAQPQECYSWGTRQGAELDLLIVRGRERLGFEFKMHSSPGYTPSMRIAQDDLKLTKLVVLHPGTHRYALARKAEAVPLSELKMILN